jgi:hypothetical protein
MSQTKMHDYLEGFIVFGVMAGILLPVRLFFFTYISTEWFGSFGIISIISIVMIILVKKQKLGKFGKMFENQLHKIQHGKRAIFVYGQTIFFLILLGGSILAIELGNSIFVETKELLLEQIDSIDEPEKMFSDMQKLTFEDWIKGFVGMIVGLFVAFPTIAGLMAIINDNFDGWILHFYTVGLVEALELFGILIFYRFNLKSKKN